MPIEVNRTDDGYEQDPAKAGSSCNDDPICAVASGGGRGAVALIRMSGRGVHSLADRVLRPHGVQARNYRRMQLYQLIDPSDGECIDEPMAVFFKGPRSFTGQDSVEIYCHGGLYIIKRVLDALYRIGFRAAEPGEFTKRAFLNGKMDLASAEGVKELVEAQSHQQWLAARSLATGRLSVAINKLREELVGAMAYLEASIDFPEEEDVESINRAVVRERVQEVSDQVEGLIRSYQNGQVASQGLKVAIVGAPNVGKSTLLNRLLGKERAIVTDIPGTTRDYLEESCLINGRLFRIFDTAGVRQTDERVEKMGIENTLKIAQQADVVLALLDSSSSTEQRLEFENWLVGMKLKDQILVATKSDINALGDKKWLPLSSHTGEGFVSLEEQLTQRVDDFVGEFEEHVCITSARHLDALKRAQSRLKAFQSSEREGQYEECLAFELQGAAKALSQIIGAVEADDLLDKIFSEFCIGK